MMKKFKEYLGGVEEEKVEAMRIYNNNRKSFRNVLRLVAVASVCYLWFPTFQIVVDWIYRIGSVVLTDRSVAFVVANVIAGLIFVVSGMSDEESDTELDLYDQYTSAVIVTVCDEKVVENDDDSNKQIVPAFTEEVTTEKESTKVVEYDESNKQIVPVVAEAVRKKGVYRRTKSETKKKTFRPVMKYRRTESAKMLEIERLNSEEFYLKVENFIEEQKKIFVLENVVQTLS